MSEAGNRAECRSLNADADVGAPPGSALSGRAARSGEAVSMRAVLLVYVAAVLQALGSSLQSGGKVVTRTRKGYSKCVGVRLEVPVLSAKNGAPIRTLFLSLPIRLCTAQTDTATKCCSERACALQPLLVTKRPGLDFSIFSQRPPSSGHSVGRSQKNKIRTA